MKLSLQDAIAYGTSTWPEFELDPMVDLPFSISEPNCALLTHNPTPTTSKSIPNKHRIAPTPTAGSSIDRQYAVGLQ